MPPRQLRLEMLLATELLDKLVGDWDLTGRMGEIPLQQAVVGKRTLGELFVELYFKSTLPAPVGQKPYEAVYYIGYNDENDLFVMHLLDTFGVGLSCIVGIGKQEGNTIPFVFDYEDGPFTNRFIWDETADAWRFEQTYLKNGQVHTFATKEMVRSR